jgi:hypothetical protein
VPATEETHQDTCKHSSTGMKVPIELEACVARAASLSCVAEGHPAKRIQSPSKEFLKAGKKRLAGDTTREAPQPRSWTCAKVDCVLKEVEAIAGSETGNSACN